VRDPATGVLIAGTRRASDGMEFADSAALWRAGHALRAFGAPEHTTIGVVAVNAGLTKSEAQTVASLAMLGFARALSPPHTAFDGDTLFVLSVGDVPADLTQVGLMAADAVARAIARGVEAATSLPGLPAARDVRRA
jgi:L-aminopeptidase/D-esterase-like protein